MTPKLSFIVFLISFVGVTILAACVPSLHPSFTETPPVLLATATPSGTPIATLTPTINQTSTSTVILTPYPTLSPAEELAKILELLKTNGGCELPCWWGITPGHTSQEEAFTFLEQIGFPPIWFDSGGWYYNIKMLTSPEDAIFIDYEIHLQEKTISYIHMRGTGGVSHRTLFAKIWESSLPEFIIPNYGTPSRVLIWSVSNLACDQSPCSKAPYELWLFYDKQGFLVRYDGTVEYKSTYVFCPTFGEAGNLDGQKIDIFLKSPQDTRSLESLLLPADGFQESKNLVDLTGTSLEEFSGHYQQNDQLFCFSTPRDIWP